MNQLLFPAYAKLAGIDANSVKWVQVAAATAARAAGRRHQVDALSTFLIGTPAHREGGRARRPWCCPTAQYLSDLYGNALFTTETYAKANPDLVKQFRDAALKGLQYTIDHPDEAGADPEEGQPDRRTPPRRPARSS